VPKAQLIFTTVIQDSQEFGSNNEHMVSKVFFDLRVGGDLYTGLAADVKQTIGIEYEHAPLEVSMPQSLAGSVSYAEFRKLVEQYYRESFSSSGSVFRFGPGTKARMMHNVVDHRSAVEIEFLDSPGKVGW